MALPQAESSIPPIQVRILSLAEARDGDRFRKAGDSRRFDIDQAVERVVPLPERGRRLGVAQEWMLSSRQIGVQLAEDLAVQHDVVVEERLLDEQEIEVVQRLKAPPVGHGVGRVGIDLEEDVEAVTTVRPRPPRRTPARS